MPDEMTKVSTRLQALLALEVDRHLRETGLAKPRERSIDKILSDAGLIPKEIASILGKTERAVQLVLQKGAKKKVKANG